MESEQSFKSINDTVDDASDLLKISNILGLQTIEKATEQSQEKHLKESIQKVQDNVAFQEELLTVQNSNLLSRECLEQLDSIFNRSLTSNTTQLDLELTAKINTKRENLAKLSRDFAEQRKTISSKYEQLRNRKLSRCELHKQIVAEQESLQSRKDLLKSLNDQILARQQKIHETNDSNKKIGQDIIVKFAKSMQMRNRKGELTEQIATNAKEKKLLEEKIKQLQWRHMGKENDLQIASYSGKDGNTQKLLKLPCAISHITTENAKITTPKTEHKPNPNTSFINTVLTSTPPFRHNTNIATSKYFQSSHTYTKSTGKKYTRTTDTVSSTTLNKSDKTIDMSHENNPGKRVKFCAQVKETSYVSNVPVNKPDTSANIEVINIIREDIVKASVQSKTLIEPKQADIIVEEPMEVYENEYGSNYAYLDGNAQYFDQDEDVASNEHTETDVDNAYSNEEMEIDGQNMFSFGNN